MVALRLGLVLARSSQVHRGGFLRLIQPEPNALQISDEAKWQAISEELENEDHTPLKSSAEKCLADERVWSSYCAKEAGQE